MSLAAELTADIRARANYIAPCPNCSFLQRPDEGPNIIVYPMLDASRRNGAFSLMRCCSLSSGCGWLDSAAAVASWWRAKRAVPHTEPAMANRQASTLARLTAAGLEPSTSQSEATP